MSSKSNWITNKLKNLDFLGEGINFTIHNEPHLKTVCGGVLQVILYLIGIFLAFYFGRDFISRKNPQVYFELKSSINVINMTYKSEDFFFAVHLENYLGENLDVSEFINILIENTLKTKYIPMFRCSNMTFDQETEYFFQKRNKSE